MKQPTPEHPIAIERNLRSVTVSFSGATLAQSQRAMTLREASYPPVVYVPREDVDMTLFQRTSHSTHCPYKGDASYYTVEANGQRAENVAWSYESPYPTAMPVKGYLAFYTDRVRVEEEA